MKPTNVGKSRLGAPGLQRSSFAFAIALDTIEAVAWCSSVRQVLVVTADKPLTQALSQFPHTAVVDDTSDGLNAAIEQGLSSISITRPRAVVLGDLPALKPQELTAALSAAGRHALSFVRDTEGSGTTCITARPDMQLTPAFGPESAAAHSSAGYREIILPSTTGLRRDIDQVKHLITLGPRLGRRTAALAVALRPAG